MTKGLHRRYGEGDLHFITFSCYRRLPLLGSPRARNIFVQILNEVRSRYQFALVGYVVMPDHVHMLMSEPPGATPSTVIQVLKQRVSREMRRGHLSDKDPHSPRFWQHRFYDFSVWSRKKRNEKLHYMHLNPVKRGLVDDPKHWIWSSYGFYNSNESSLVRIDPV